MSGRLESWRLDSGCLQSPATDCACGYAHPVGRSQSEGLQPPATDFGSPFWKGEVWGLHSGSVACHATHFGWCAHALTRWGFRLEPTVSGYRRVWLCTHLVVGPRSVSLHSGVCALVLKILDLIMHSHCGRPLSLGVYRTISGHLVLV